jgi:4-phospho-D-threonate 3-dehydrogenase / 4-phospho-D-erythronate 3-dehydrogenase
LRKPIIGITVGDPCGIGPEITIKSLCNPEIYSLCTPVVIADVAVIKEALRVTGKNMKINPISRVLEKKLLEEGINVIGDVNQSIDNLEYGKITKYGGEASFRYIKRAIELSLQNEIDAVVTGPIHKKALNMAGVKYAGHTEIFASLTNTKSYCMMLVHGEFRVSHITTHVPIRDVPDLVTEERVLEVIRLTHQGLIDLGLKNPKIGVAGLNPHSGDEGLFGMEEIEHISPAIAAACAEGLNVEGPIPPDTVFVRMKGSLHDAVVAMYHDQGHIPVKLDGFEYDMQSGKWKIIGGVNITLGLPLIRTSVDHGVAFGKSGKGTADPQSMIDAINIAALMASK